jgi:cytosine/creatinine deaminase
MISDMQKRGFKSPFYKELHNAIRNLGGLYNAHIHLDRAGTLDLQYKVIALKDASDDSFLSLSDKHAFIAAIHNSSVYNIKKLTERINNYLDIMVSVGTSHANTFVDVTCDRVGLSALEVMLEIKRLRDKEIDLIVGAYSPMGFKDSEPEHWDLLVKGAELADFIGSLPERDDRKHYPSHIGFYEHCKRILILGQRLNKPIHMQIDQHNDPSEKGTEIFLQALQEVGVLSTPSGEPMVWLIHVISPSTYDEVRFRKLLDGLFSHNIGVICCPSAAISIRQLRPIKTPTSNSIARILEMLTAGIYVRLGSDNIADIFSPAGTPDLIDEIFLLSNAIRFYHVGILAKLAAGVRLNDEDKCLIMQHLINDNREINRAVGLHE